MVILVFVHDLSSKRPHPFPGTAASDPRNGGGRFREGWRRTEPGAAKLRANAPGEGGNAKIFKK